MADAVQKSMAQDIAYIRVQFGEGGYGGGGFIRAGQGNRPEGGYNGPAFDEEIYVENVPKVFEYVRSKVGFGPKLCHDVHSHLSGINAVDFSRRLQPYQMFFVEDVLAPEQFAWYKQIRQVCTTPQAVGEVFLASLRVRAADHRPADRFHALPRAAIGGITPARKLRHLCETHGVRTAFQEGGENDPVNQIAAYHVDISPGVRYPGGKSLPGGRSRDPSRRRPHTEGLPVRLGQTGLGLISTSSSRRSTRSAKAPQGGPYPTDRALDGSVVRP